MFLPLVAAGCASLPGSAPAEDPSMKSFAEELDSLREARRIPGLSVAVIRDGEVILARGLGYADLEGRVAATENTAYDVASVTKPISAVAALRMVERGELDLDRRMSTFRGFPEFCADVRGETGIFFRDYGCDSPRLTLRHLLSMRANGVPGERFFYNPPSYSWASRPIAEVAGIPFSELVAREVFTPAGMTASARIHRRLPLRADVAAALAPPHRLDSLGAVVRAASPPAQGDGAAGGVVSTVTDLARFDQALDGGRLIGEAARREMWTPGRSSAGAVLPYGLGWFVQEVEGRRVVWHSGVWDGAYSALYLKVPDERLTLILLANSDGIRWGNPLDRAEVEKSPFAVAFLGRFARAVSVAHARAREMRSGVPYCAPARRAAVVGDVPTSLRSEDRSC
jgi:CubicO group peptidase (beta-lactamase class C family)